ncbi:MAG: glycosyltransferase family 87 protein [Isosphaeraceae bacterium]
MPTHVLTRQRSVLLVLYGTLVAGWLGFARWGAPATIVAAHEGKSLPYLNRLVRGTGVPLSLEQVFTNWSNFTWAVVLAIVAHFMVVLFIDLFNRWNDKHVPQSARRADRWIDRLLVLLALAFFALAVLAGGIQDYFLYLAMWRGVWTGHDPWALTFGAFGDYPLNAYGPLFNVLAVPAWINLLFPKLLFALAHLGFAIWLIKEEGADRRRSLPGNLLLVLWLFNPYLWIEIPCFGHFDILVGICCVVAVAARRRGRDERSAIAVGLGVLIKFMPIVLLPFLILDGKRYRFRLLAVALGVIAAGFLISVLIWGTSTFRPLTFAARRTTQHLSIFRFLNGTNSPLSWIGLHEDTSILAGPLLLLALLRAWNWSRKNQIDPLVSSVLAILIMITLYPVGFPQYQIVLFVLATFWLTREGQPKRARPLVYAAMGCHFGWMAAFVVTESVVNIDTLGMQEWIGLPTFILECLLGAAIVHSAQAVETNPDLDHACCQP